MSQEGKTIHPVSRAVLAIIALVVIVVSGNMLVSSLGIGHKSADLTEDRIHSLSDGTKSILRELGAPVVIRYYASRSSDYMPERLKLHMRRVDDMLDEYESIADGMLKVEHLDPEPDTDAEDSANLDGISGQPINNEDLYFGLAVSCLDRTATLPFLSPNDETTLEYEISRAIAEVSATRKPTIGLMSGMPITGGAAAMPGQPPAQPWVFYNQLSRFYEIEDLTMTPAEIDPDKYNLVLVFHPTDITEEAEFALDQYLLQGGTIVACVDPYSVAARMTGGGNPMMGGGGTPVASDLPKLFEGWGLELSSQVVGDPTYATDMNANRTGLAVLTVTQEGMPIEDSVITKDLSSVTLFLPGGLTKSGGGGVSAQTLIKASPQAGLVDNLKASNLDPSLITSFRPDGKTHELAVHLSGNFKTAFPDGKPGEEEAEETPDSADPSAEAGEDEDASEESAEGDEESADPGYLTEATKAGNVFVISDVDAFYDRFAYSIGNFGRQEIVLGQLNGNVPLLFNIIDQAASSTHLIGARSRAATSRPFTVFREMEAEANQRVGKEIEAFETQAEEAQKKLDELQSQKTQGTELFLSPEQEAEIRKFREQEVEARKKIRELQKELKREKDQLKGQLTLANIAIVPLAVIVAGILFFIGRKKRTRAR